MTPARSGVLVTGGSGYLGHELARQLLSMGYLRVCIYSRNEFNQARMRDEFHDDERLRFFIGDVRDRDRLERAMSSVQHVIHAAALKRIEVGTYCADEMVKTNVLGSMNVIEAARRAAVEKVLLVSSDKAYEPISPYGQSKAMAESLFLQANDPQYGPRFSVVRYGNVAGSTGSVIPTWRAALANGGRVRMTDPECTRFWMTREEAAQLVLTVLQSMGGGERAIPTLPAFRLGDLAAAMDIPHWEAARLGHWEKLHECMEAGNCSHDARRLNVEELRERLAQVT